MAKRKTTQTNPQPSVNNAPDPGKSTGPDGGTLFGGIVQSEGDDFFDDLSNDTPFIKMAAEGFAGSGKSYTLGLIAAGLYKMIGSKRPIVLFDTENSDKFLVPLFEEWSISVKVKKSRTLADLEKSMTLCRDGYSDIIMIDSVSHIWQKFLEDYLKAHKEKFLSIRDWGIVKPLWREYFTEPFVDGRFHAFFTGRAGDKYESEIDEKTGKREFFKSGIKMRGEGETAYEPDILLLMERLEQVTSSRKPKKVWREATVLKSRYPPLDGKTFINPTIKDFKSAFEWILNSVTKREEPPKKSYTNDALLEADDDKREFIKQKNIALEEIEAFGTKQFGGAQSSEAKRNKVMMLEFAFGTASWTAIKDRSVNDLREGLKKMKFFIDVIEGSKISDNGEGSSTDPTYSAYEQHKRAIESAGDAVTLKRAADAVTVDYDTGNLTNEQHAELETLILQSMGGK